MSIDLKISCWPTRLSSLTCKIGYENIVQRKQIVVTRCLLTIFFLKTKFQQHRPEKKENRLNAQERNNGVVFESVCLC